METPLSTRRVTQTAAASASASNKNTLVSKRSDESNSSKSRQGNNGGKLQQQQETSSKYALLDITNNSPIVGVAKGNLLQTPSSSSCFGKKSSSRRGKVSTPGSGEILLRDQVKTLLQKVEEEAAELSKVEFRPSLSSLFHHHHHHFHGFVHSPMGLLLAPTPTNTPQVLTTQSDEEGLSLTYPDPPPILTSQVVVNEEEEVMNSHQITRSLLLDFSDKSEVIESCLSEKEEEFSSKLNAEHEEEEEEDSSSGWSVQVNVSSSTSHDELVDELCLGIQNMEMGLIKGNHKRFIYNSDDDMVAEQVVVEDDKLKGLPTPQGKHIRFEEEEDEDDDDANTIN